MSQENVEIAKDFYDAYNARNSDALDRLLHPEAEMIEEYREVGERVVALGVARGAGTSSHVEVASDFAAVLLVRDSQIVLVDSYSNWEDALNAAAA